MSRGLPPGHRDCPGGFSGFYSVPGVWCPGFFFCPGGFGEAGYSVPGVEEMLAIVSRGFAKVSRGLSCCPGCFS